MVFSAAGIVNGSMTKKLVQLSDATSTAETNWERSSGRRVCLVALYPERDDAMPQQLSNHGMRMIQASLVSAEISSLELLVLDLHDADVETTATAIVDFGADIVGFSTFIWSFEFSLAVATLVRQRNPDCLIVFGGPSARPSMFDLRRYRECHPLVDVLVINEGEETFVEIVSSPNRDRESLIKLRGVSLFCDGQWTTHVARPLGDLNLLPSPYEMGLVPAGGLAMLQTYRGCPFTCSFCEWGVLESPKRVRTAESLIREFEAMKALKKTGALIVDAGLNLNENAFRNLETAVDVSGFFQNRQLICEVYPARLKPPHFQFLESIGSPYVGMGLQSFDNDVLAHVERSYDETRFEDNLYKLTDNNSVALEIILGLPGDSPEQFRRSFERARRYPCALRVYHCVVLPSALMVRAPAEYNMNFDEKTLKMLSCLGWTPEAILREAEYITLRANTEGGQVGEYFWVFPPPVPR